jgi:hypothetical protein
LHFLTNFIPIVIAPLTDMKVKWRADINYWIFLSVKPLTTTKLSTTFASLWRMPETPKFFTFQIVRKVLIWGSVTERKV